MSQLVLSSPSWFSFVSRSRNPFVSTPSTSHVQFEDSLCAFEEVETIASSTHDYIRRHVGGDGDNSAWAALAAAFDCTDKKVANSVAEDGLTEELLELCSWFRDEEDNFDLDEQCDDDSEDEEWFSNLRAHVRKESENGAASSSVGQSSSGCSSAATTSRLLSVRDLRFDSLLKLGKNSSFFDHSDDDTVVDRTENVPLFAPELNSQTQCCSTDSSESSSSAVLLERAFQGVIEDDNSCSSVQSQKNGSTKSNSEDFWGDVQF